MEAQQCVKLSLTNRSIGLILFTDGRKTSGPTSCRTLQALHWIDTKRQTPMLSCIDLVALARAEPPDPIPNSAVKPLSADGTASQGVGE